MDSITTNSFGEYLEKHGKRGSMVVDGLNDLIPSLQYTFNTSIGKEILKEDIETCEVLITKILNEEATDLEKAEFRYLRSRIIRLGEKLDKYLDLVSKVKRG